MRLVSVEVHGLGRFGERAKMNVAGRVIGIVGPNEAGKTSLLRALDSLRDNDPFSQSAYTRGQSEPVKKLALARFRVDSSDRAEIGPLPGIDDLRWYVYWKNRDGSRTHIVEPEGCLKRNLTVRNQVADNLRRAAAHKKIDGLPPAEGQMIMSDLFAGIAQKLETGAESLSEEEIDHIRASADAIEPSHMPAALPTYIRTLPEQLRELAGIEEDPHPREIALGVLDRRCPEFQLFGAAERDLQSDYDLNEVASSPPSALSNLSHLGALDLEALRDAQAAQNYGLGEKLVEDANATLKARFEEAWRQSGVFLRLATDENILRIFVSTVDGYTSIAERSDGLRAFIALLSFTALHSSDAPLVLLVDEAENHLHYDAQADLIRVFSQQEAADKIIYTTHSAGCLPNDLAGVRMIEPLEGGLSRVANSYWVDGPGLSPLLIGMGARALAFTPARRALFTEGGSDALLLPAILKSALGLEELKFQIVPGLSEIAPVRVPDLNLDAAAVAYLVDGDDAGRKIAVKLKRGTVPEDRIFSLGRPDSELTTEDLLDERTYVDAVRAVLGCGRNGVPELPQAAGVSPGRCSRVKEWCIEVGLKEPNKVAVAYEVLELLAEGANLVDTSCLGTVLGLYGEIGKVLNLDQV